MDPVINDSYLSDQIAAVEAAGFIVTARPEPAVELSQMFLEQTITGGWDFNAFKELVASRYNITRK